VKCANILSIILLNTAKIYKYSKLECNNERNGIYGFSLCECLRRKRKLCSEAKCCFITNIKLAYIRKNEWNGFVKKKKRTERVLTPCLVKTRVEIISYLTGVKLVKYAKGKIQQWNK